jgi:hypothetical protein
MTWAARSDVEEQFTHVLQFIHDERYVLTDAEWAVTYRAVHDCFNPRGVLWAATASAFAVAATSHRAAKRRPLQRCLKVAGAALYAYELSWAFRDRYPIHNFFRELARIDSPLNNVAHMHPGVLAVSDTRPAWMRFVDFVTLDCTFDAAWMSLEPSTCGALQFRLRMQKHMGTWLALFAPHLERHPDRLLVRLWRYRVGPQSQPTRRR